MNVLSPQPCLPVPVHCGCMIGSYCFLCIGAARPRGLILSPIPICTIKHHVNFIQMFQDLGSQDFCKKSQGF